MRKAIVLGAMFALASVATQVSAAPIFGRFNMTFGTVVVNATTVDFTPIGGGSGNFTVDPTVATRSGSFLDPVFNALPSDGTIGDLNAVTDPVGVPLARLPYITLAEKPTWNFQLTLVTPGATAGPFSLTQLGPNVSATITVNGLAWIGPVMPPMGSGDLSNWTAIISSQYTNTTVAALLALVGGGGTLPENSWSGTFEAQVIPEPASLSLIGLGLATLGARFRRRS